MQQYDRQLHLPSSTIAGVTCATFDSMKVRKPLGTDSAFLCPFMSGVKPGNYTRLSHGPQQCNWKYIVEVD